MSVLDQFLSDAGRAAGGSAAGSGISGQFAADLASPAPQAKPADSVVGSALDFASAFGHHLMNLPNGIAQLVENGVNGVAQALPDNPVSRYIGGVVDRDNQAMASREQQYQSSTPTNAASLTGAGIGEVAPFLFGGGLMKGLSAAGGAVGNIAAKALPDALGYVPKLADFATQGALVGAASPVTSGDHGSQKLGQIESGAIAGPLVKVGADALAGTGSAIKQAAAPILSPKSYVANQLRNKLGADLPGVLDNIQNAPTFVPGSQPLTDQVAGNGTLVQMAKALANSSPDFKNSVVARSAENDAARLASLRSIAQTPQTLADAISTRSNIASPLYDAAHQATAPLDDTFMAIVQRPAVQQAMEVASKMAKNENVPIQWPTPDNPIISGKALDYTNRALGDMIDQAVRSGASQQARALTMARNEISEWGQNAIPQLKDAQSAYATNSVPINTMQVGQDLMGALSNRSQNAIGNPILTAQSYNSQLAKALRNQDFPIDPAAQETLQNIGQDLLRETRSNSIRTPGSDTGYNLNADGWLANALYGKNFGGSHSISSPARLIGGVLGAAAGQTIGHPLMGLGAGYGVAEKLASFAGKRVNGAASDLFLNPGDFMTAMRAAAQQPGNPHAQAIADALRRYSPGVAAYQAARPGPPQH